MSTLSVRLPESLHKHLKDVSEREGVSINQFIATAVAEKMSALLTAEYLDERAQRGSRSAFDRVLAKVPDLPAREDDRIDAQAQAQKSCQAPSLDSLFLEAVGATFNV